MVTQREAYEMGRRTALANPGVAFEDVIVREGTEDWRIYQEIEEAEDMVLAAIVEEGFVKGQQEARSSAS